MRHRRASIDPALLSASELDVESKLEDLLIAAGVHADLKLVEQLENVISDLATTRAAEFVRFLLSDVLGGTPRNEGFRRVLFGDDGESTRQCAKRIGCSHVAVLKAEQRAREWFKVTTGRIDDRRKS